MHVTAWKEEAGWFLSKLTYQVMANRKKLTKKKNELKELHIGESFYLIDSMCTENHNLFHKCHQLENAKRIHSCWFFNNVINVRLIDKGPLFNIFHEWDLRELLRAKVDDLLSKSSSQFKTCDCEIIKKKFSNFLKFRYTL